MAEVLKVKNILETSGLQAAQRILARLIDKQYRRTLSSLWQRIPTKLNQQFWILLVGMAFVAVVETGAVGILALFATVLSGPEGIEIPGKIAAALSGVGVDVPSQWEHLLVLIGIATVVAVGLKNGLSALIAFKSARFAALVDSYMGEQVLHGILRMPYEWHCRHNSADLVKAVDWRIYLGSTVLESMNICSEILVISFVVVSLLLVNPVLYSVVLFVVGIMGYMVYLRVKPHLDVRANKSRHLMLSINMKTTQTIHGIREVKIFGKEQPFVAGYTSDANQLSDNQASLALWQRSPVWIMEFLGFLVLASVITSLVYVTPASRQTLTGTIALLAVAAFRLLPAASRIQSRLASVRLALPGAGYVLDYLDEFDHWLKNTPALEDARAGGVLSEKVPNMKKEVVLDNVFFRYNENTHHALSEVTLAISCGESIGVIGASGAGKSTLIDMLTALLIPAERGLYVDGISINHGNSGQWTRQIGYVSQSPFILDATLAENIAFGVESNTIDREWVLECCRMAHVHEFIVDLPEGIDTPIGERGARLSGGQRQRVAIARALYHRPSVIMLDEATSALDPKSECAIQQMIRELSRQVTIIIIAHRLATVKECSRIVWLDKGRIHRDGPADEVLEEYMQSE